MENGNRAVQMIDRHGNFNAAELEEFMGTTGLSNCGNSYAVVAIMGPQSSGKSTLLNHLFRTEFREMDALRGRSKTTQGIWVAKCADAAKPFIVAMDVEGSDGRERGQDDTAFEKKSALFALAVADIVMVNMWCHDVGREHAASKPLLRTVFQVMMQIFPARKTTLLFVLRDQTKTPLELLEHTVRKDTEEIWNSFCEPTIHVGSPLSKFFNVEVIALSSFEREEELFKEQAARLRQRLLKSLSPGLFGHGIVPGSEFSFSSQLIWGKIKENKHLNLPEHKVMIAKIRCPEIANEKFQQLYSNVDWLAYREKIQFGRIVAGFGGKMSTILEYYFSEYDGEAQYYDKGVRAENRQHLVSKALELVHPTYLKLLDHLYREALESFKNKLKNMLNEGEGFTASVESCNNSAMLQFKQACDVDGGIRQANWDTSKVQEQLFQDIDLWKCKVYDEVLSKWKVTYEEEQLNKELSQFLEFMFRNPSGKTWAQIRKHLRHVNGDNALLLSAGNYGFDLDLSKSYETVQELRHYARNVVEREARKEAETENLLPKMKARYKTILKREEVRKEARIESLKLLSVMAAMRLDETPDKIENKLFYSLIDKNGSPQALSSITWEPEVSAKDTLISPVQCKLLWKRFREDIKKESIKKIAKNTALAAGAAVTGVGVGVGVGASIGIGISATLVAGGVPGIVFLVTAAAVRILASQSDDSTNSE